MHPDDGKEGDYEDDGGGGGGEEEGEGSLMKMTSKRDRQQAGRLSIPSPLRMHFH